MRPQWCAWHCKLEGSILHATCETLGFLSVFHITDGVVALKPAQLLAQGHGGEYVATGYFARMSARKAGFPDRSETNTSSSLIDLAAHDEPMAEAKGQQ